MKLHDRQAKSGLKFGSFSAGPRMGVRSILRMNQQKCNHHVEAKKIGNFDISQKCQGSSEMISRHPRTAEMMQVGPWDAVAAIKENFRIPKTNSEFRPGNWPKMCPGQHQTASDHRSEARVSKIDEIEGGNSRGVTIPA